MAQDEDRFSTEDNRGWEPEELLQTHGERLVGIQEQHVYWDYEDIGFFFLAAFFLGLLLHSAVRLDLLSPLALSQPTLPLQAFVSLSLIVCLHTILKIRYRRPVWRALGWTRPRSKHAVHAVLGGVFLAAAVILFLHWTNWSMPKIRLWELVLLGALLGPTLEETFFRGFLLPTVSRTTGVPLAVLVCALMFAALHKPPTVAQWVSFTITGLAYGWIRVNSGSTTAAILMHAVYNLTLFLYQLTGT